MAEANFAQTSPIGTPNTGMMLPSGAPIIAGDPWQWRANALLSDPNFLSLLSGIGANLDPQGFAGAIGKPTQQLIANKAAQNVAAKSLAQGKEITDAHKKMIDLLGGFSTKGTPGVTSAKVTKDNALQLEVDPHPVSSDPNNVESLISDNARAYSDTALTDTSGRTLHPKLGAEPSVPDQVQDLFAPWMPRDQNPIVAPVAQLNEPATGVEPITAQPMKAATSQPVANLERPAQLALDSYRALEPAMKERVHRAVDAALVQNPSISKEELLSLIGIESHYNPNAVGPVTRFGWSAKGLTQLSPDNLKKYSVNDPFNVEANVNAGAAYYAELKAKYNGDQRLALAAYNAGENAVKRHGNNVPGYSETQAYVRNVPALSNALVQLSNTNPGVRTESVPTSTSGIPSSPSETMPNLVAPQSTPSNSTVSATVPDTNAQVQELISTARDTSGVRGAPRSNLISADDLRGLSPEQVNAVVGRAQQNDALAVQIAELTGQTVREIRKDLNQRQLETRKAKLQAAKDISESSLSPEHQKSALERLSNTSRLDDVLELAITAAGLPKSLSAGTDREAVASELFNGRKYSQLDSTQQAKVNTELVARSTSGSEVVTTEAGIFVIDKRTNTARQVTVAPGTLPIPSANTTPTTPTPATVTSPGAQSTPTTPSAQTENTAITLAPGAPLPGKEPARPTENMAKALNFGTRALQANDIIANLEARGETGTSATLAFLEGLGRTNLLAAGAGGAGVGGTIGGAIGGTIGIVSTANPAGATLAIPGAKLGSTIGGGLVVTTVLLAEGIANRLRTAEQQQYFQAKADFVGAILRKESGAAINKDEFEKEEMRYFPRPSDSPEVMEQKARARARALQSLEKESGQKLLPPSYDTTTINPERQTAYYREHFKAISADDANAELIKNIYSNVRPALVTAGVQAFKETYKADPQYLPYAQKVFTPNLVEQTPTMRTTVMDKVRNQYTPSIASGNVDAWLIVLDGIKVQQLESFSIPQRAAIRGRMKALGLPRKVESE